MIMMVSKTLLRKELSMVYHVLELYLFQKKHYKKQSRQIADVKYNLTVIYICLIITSILWIIELFI